MQIERSRDLVELNIELGRSISKIRGLFTNSYIYNIQLLIKPLFKFVDTFSGYNNLV